MPDDPWPSFILSNFEQTRESSCAGFPLATHSTGLAMKDLRQAETSTNAAPSGWDKFDRVLLGALVIGAILATAVFAYIVVRFVH